MDMMSEQTYSSEGGTYRDKPLRWLHGEVRTPPFGAPEQAAVKATRLRDVVDRESKVEQRNRTHGNSPIKTASSAN